MRYHTILAFVVISILVLLKTTTALAQCPQAAGCGISLGPRSPGNFEFQDGLITIDSSAAPQGHGASIAPTIAGQWIIGFQSVDLSVGGTAGNDVRPPLLRRWPPLA